MLIGDIITDRTTTCGCGRELMLSVQKDNKFYIGFHCPNCGTYSKEDDDFGSREAAEAALKAGFYN